MSAGRIAGTLQRFLRHLLPRNVVILDYPVNSRPRWGERAHPELYSIINAHRDAYRERLASFLAFRDDFLKIPVATSKRDAPGEPFWNNGWTPGLDGLALYAFLASNKPKLYMEVGSGNSTKFARRAIRDHGLSTRIVSIDPSPRTEIDTLCDEVIRQPVEDVDVALFDRLDAGDILYIDNSHRVLMNSDAMAIFLDVIPRLKAGVLVEIHDVTLPYDYPADWADRYYSEQYLLAAYVLARGTRFEIVLPNAFISSDYELRRVLAPIWGSKELAAVDWRGCSFWIRMT